jgi:hypothetical protein
MSKPIVFTLAALMVAAAGVPAVSNSAAATELLPPPPIVHASHHHAVRWCGPCGCLHVRYAYHRELRSTYGLDFDPRNFDQTEPYFYLGRTRAYPRYWVSADPMN